MVNNRKKITKNWDPKLKQNFTKMKKSLAEAGALRAPPPWMPFSAPASSSRGHDPNPIQIRTCQPLKLEPGNLRKCICPKLAGENFRIVRPAKIQELFALLTEITENGSQTSSRALVLGIEIHQTIPNRFWGSRSSRMGKTGPKRTQVISRFSIKFLSDNN